MAEEKEELQTFLPVEDILKDDDSGEELNALLQKLQEAAMAIKKKMDAGVSVKEFNELDSLYQALDVGARVLFISWKSYHPQ